MNAAEKAHVLQMYKFYSKSKARITLRANKGFRIMKTVIILTLFTILQARASTMAQNITLIEKNAPLKKVFLDIGKQTGLDFLASSKVLNLSIPVTIDVKNEPLTVVLDKVFADQPLNYTLQEKIVIVTEKQRELKQADQIQRKIIDVSGYIKDGKGMPLTGATIKLKGQNIATNSNSEGFFELKSISEEDVLIISFIGYQTREISITHTQQPLNIILEVNSSPLNEIQIIAYGQTTKRLLTGSVSSVKAVDIEKQPISNPLGALEGRVPGLLITQNSGVSGSSYKVQLNGQGSLLQGSDPFFVIDGVPFAPGNASISQVPSAAGFSSTTANGISPFSLINPNDIESIEVLKDADATAIYGSRGANGVVLITTKRGKAGKTSISGNIYSGVSHVTRMMNYLNTQQYVEMRKEALKNDGVTPDATNAPDLILWDTTRYTDFKKLLIGNTAHITDAQLSVSGGDQTTQFFIGGGYHRETTVYPTDNADQKGSFHFNINHNSANKKFTINLSASYLADRNDLPGTDLSSYVNTSPNLKLYDNNGKPAWSDGGLPYINSGILNANPLAFKYQTYEGNFQNLNSSLQSTYRFSTDLSFKVSLGYNVVNSAEVATFPSVSLDPNLGQQPFSYFGNSIQKSWIIEPQVNYNKRFKRNKIELLLGGTWQDETSNGINVSASNYSSDLLLKSISAAGLSQTVNNDAKYNYQGIYGRINYVYDDKYILNLSGRRDGSSRFGPDKRFSNFGAIGAAWLFSEQQLIAEKLTFLSFGKLRASYGITGNDQIGDYRYLDTWSPGTTTYQGVSVLNPTSLYNPNFSWEKNEKLTFGLDLGFWKDRLLFTVEYYRNHSNNQLVNYTLPSQTGFTSVLENLNAEIQNTGWQFQATSTNFHTTNFSWTTSLNLTLPQNKLISFPGLANSTYANIYTIGQSLSTTPLFHYLGVDPSSGVYQFLDVDNNGVYNSSDKISRKSTDPKFYGGIQNNLRFKNWDLSFFWEFRKQDGRNYLNNLVSPGTAFFNQPNIVLSRWQKTGDVSNVEKFTETSGTAYNAFNNYLKSSDGIISDASYLRLKNVAISYQIKADWVKKAHFSSLRLYLQGQNLLTLTKYLGADPENQSALLPPLQTFTAGLQFTL
ncbi:SusC/RagA family TonB-linked outer membrane protein [Mucilaginibacter agri]|uniref:SusC/RagA family TonB-linked outer membrane protein n=1 Tax=Mucilaginibacter agri TaxID=2695265 RepID=A0A965ZFA0_9SPHI|nr:SusC/RagA family TonB-linked outer membrane protein [Mucilaginibacter agri]NCD68586.1 SusC/RagA family TonB-linked outer membrane protein [Mucilaginibacter agri]